MDHSEDAFSSRSLRTWLVDGVEAAGGDMIAATTVSGDIETSTHTVGTDTQTELSSSPNMSQKLDELEAGAPAVAVAVATTTHDESTLQQGSESKTGESVRAMQTEKTLTAIDEQPKSEGEADAVKAKSHQILITHAYLLDRETELAMIETYIRREIVGGLIVSTAASEAERIRDLDVATRQVGLLHYDTSSA